MCIQIQTKSDNNLKLDVISVDDGITDIYLTDNPFANA